MYVYMILTLFYRGRSPQLGISFTTHFSICHSFLDSYIKADLAPNWEHRILARNWGGCPGWHSRTVAQYLSLRHNRRPCVCVISLRPNRSSIGAQKEVTCHTPRPHVTPRGHMSQNHENPPAFNFPLCSKKIEIDLGHIW